MLDDYLKRLKHPERKYKPIPFWSWNGKLEQDELRRQIRDMAQAGYGGCFVHARAGLKTEYFSREWMDAIAACVDEGRKAGVAIWLYDENGFPSGFAGGAVPALGEAYRQKYLRFETGPYGQLGSEGTTLAVYRRAGGWQRVSPEKLAADEPALRAYYTVNPYYSDLLNPDAVRAFIGSTYEPYYREFGPYFGREIPGIFTDEPQYGRGGMPWSFVIPGAFRARRGYDVLDCLPAVFEDAEDAARLRSDFWQTVAELFRGNCAGQLYNWCEAHHCQLTGHVLLEETMRWQTLCSGSAMGIYSRMHIPGIDWLGRQPGNPVSVKQAASAAAQAGRELVLSEMFACSGWNTSLGDFKRIAEWQYALGVNLTCAHLYAYSLAGVRKKDHPPGISYQSNWWDECRAFNDTFTRLGQLLSEGMPAPQLLVIHPLHSVWAAFDGVCGEHTGNAETERLDGLFIEISQRLTGLHLEYHYADEDTLAEAGSASDGTLTVGRCSYRAVLIPPAATLEPHTARLLEAFADGGGKLYAFEEFPAMLHGTPDASLAALKARCIPISMDGLKPLEEAGCRALHVTGPDGLEMPALYHRVAFYPDGAAVFLVNMDEDGAVDATVRVPGCMGAWKLDLTACAAEPLPVKADGGVTLRFTPCQSAVLFFTKERSETPAPVEAHVPTRVKLGEPWRVKAQTPNALVLDTCRWREAGGSWSEPLAVALLQDRLLALGRSTDIELEFTVQSNVDFYSEQIELVVEDLGNYVVTVNDEVVPNRPLGWWKDVSFGRLDVAGRIHAGRNTIRLATRFENSGEQMQKLERAGRFEAEKNMLTYLSEVDNIVLLGDFSVAARGETLDDIHDALRVEGPFALDRRRESAGMELTSGGWPFFTGRIRLEQEIILPRLKGSAMFRMGRPHCAYSRLYVNGSLAHTFRWEPYEADITAYVREGVNTVAIELVSTDRNLFGPHHHPRGELTAVGPSAFTDANGWDGRYSLVRFGPGEDAEILYQA